MSVIVSATESALGFEYVFCPEKECPGKDGHEDTAAFTSVTGDSGKPHQRKRLGRAHHVRLFRHNDRPEGWTAEDSLARAIADEQRAQEPATESVSGVGTVA